MASGRLCKYREEHLSLVEDGFKEGASITEICAEIGICRDTWNEWEHTNKVFSDTVKRFKPCSEAWWMTKGRVNLENKQFSPVLWYMNMRNRFGWRDKQEIEHTGEAFSNLLLEIASNKQSIVEEKNDKERVNEKSKG